MPRWIGILGRWTANLIFTALGTSVAAYAFGYLFAAFRSGDPFAAQFAISGYDVPLHFFLAGVSLLVAPLQLSAALRRRLPWLHRQIGWLYAASVLVGATAGLSLAMNAQGGLPSRLGFSILAVVWPCVTALGIRNAMKRDFEQHRRWMYRSVALTYSAVTLRVMLGIGLALQLPFMPVYITASWASWIVNLAACELILRWPALRARFAGAMRSAFRAARA
ncbi:MAG: DUF2306 domain-containing protein [Burkholderiales bacterium]